MADSVLLAIRKNNTVLICFEPTLDAQEFEAVIDERLGAAVDLEVDRPRRRVRLRSKTPRCAEAAVRALSGRVPVLDLS